VDKDGNPVGTQSETPAVAGDNLVLSIDSGVQKATEKALADGIIQARTRPDKNKGGAHYAAPTGAAITVEVNTGRVVAMASYPSYDPTQFVGGISNAAYYKLLHGPGHPLISNAVQGSYAPGSTFKIVATTAAVKAGYSLSGSYYCPGQIRIGGSIKHNFEGESGGYISFEQTLIESCDTVFYQLAFQQWLRDGGLTPKPGQAKEVFAKEARIWGFGKKTGIDLPDERQGLITDRAYLQSNWKQLRADYCKGATTHPDDPQREQFDKEKCATGYQLQAGEAANVVIGQGDVLVTPLQLAMAYAALVNGGVLYQPQIVKGFVSADGTRITEVPPKITGHVDTSPGVAAIRAYIQNALGGVPHPPKGTAKVAFQGFPFQTLPIGGKTGTADVNKKSPTSWFASFAPLDHPKYVTMVMVPESGTGGTTAAPIARKIWDAIYGLEGAKAALKSGALPKGLPVVRNDGTIAPPGTHVVRPSPTGTTQSLGLPWAEEPRRSASPSRRPS
ncbi:MAG: penicillin-binding protein 2, partial [Frankiales bacterium]|nr:penicillin-binding protein 2 [Frankiales bacterium]